MGRRGRSQAPAEVVALATPRLDGGRLTVDVRVSPGVARYVAEDSFWVDYGPDADLGEVPEAVLAIPAVGNLITLAWTLGAELRVGALDARYAAALAGIARTVQGIYPKLKTARAPLRVGQKEKVVAADAGRVGLLFSGGLDSNVALIEHRERVTDLFTIWGADVPIDDRALWDHLAATIAANRTIDGGARHVVASNMRRMLRNDLLAHDFGPFLLTGSWWGGIQVGLGLQSLLAPVALRRGIGQVIEASSLTRTPGQTFIFSPDVDEQIAYAGTTVRHDGFDLSRQEKIRSVLAPYVRQGHEVPLAVCYKRERGGDSLNCGVCEKCVRTQIGLLLEGVDPNACGFRFSAETVDEILGRFAAHQYAFDDVTTAMWTGLQALIPEDPARLPDVHGARRFFAWLRTLDVPAYEKRAFLAQQPFLRGRVLAVGSPLLRALPAPAQRRIRAVLG